MVAKIVDTKGVIKIEEFKKRLADFCLNRGGGGLPRKRRDQHILFKSINLWLSPKTTYTETELNAQILSWLELVGKEIQIDHVSLRRCLVDEGYITRDPAGGQYASEAEAHSNLFDPSVDTLDPTKLIEDAVSRREERKRRHIATRVNSDN